MDKRDFMLKHDEKSIHSTHRLESRPSVNNKILTLRRFKSLEPYVICRQGD